MNQEEYIATKKNNCVSKSRKEAKKRGDELNNMYSDDSMLYNNPEYIKIAKENRRLQTNCYNNCGAI